MSAMIHIHGKYALLSGRQFAEIECADDEPTIWIRHGGSVVSLTLTAPQLDALELAIKNARTFDLPTPEDD